MESKDASGKPSAAELVDEIIDKVTPPLEKAADILDSLLGRALEGGYDWWQRRKESSQEEE